MTCQSGITLNSFWYYTDCCGQFISGSDPDMEVCLDTSLPYANVVTVGSACTITCLTLTPTPSPTITPAPDCDIVVGYPESPTPTATVTQSVTPTISLTASVTQTISPSPTDTPDVTQTPTATPTETVTPTVSVSDTPTPTPTETVTPTVSVSDTPTPTPTETVTPTVSVSDTPTQTPTETVTPTVSVSDTPTPTPTETVTPTVSVSDTPTPTPTETVTPTVSVSDTPTPTNTPSGTNTPTPTETVTPTEPSGTQTPTPTVSVSDTPTATPTETVTPTVSVSDTPTPTPTETVTPTVSVSDTPTSTPTETITQTPTLTVTPTQTITPTQAIVPSDPTLEIYYQGSLATYFSPTPSSGNTFTQWVDSSSSAHNANAVGGSNKPQWWSNQQCGLGGVYFNGTSMGLSVNPLTDLQSKAGETIIVVARTLDSGTTQQYIQAGEDGNTGILETFIRQSGSTYNIAMGGGFATGGVVTTGTTILSVKFDGTQTGNSNRMKFRINGCEQSLNFITNVGTITSSLTSYVFLGVSYSEVPSGVLQYWYNGLLFDVLVYSRALTDTELSVVETYLSNHWCISIGCPTPTPSITQTVTPSA